MINFQCPQCQKKIKAPDSAGGRQANCPGCKSPIKVPAAEPELILAVEEPQQPQTPPPTQAGRYLTPNDIRQMEPNAPRKKSNLLTIAAIALAVVFVACSGAISLFISSFPKPTPRTPEQVAADKQAAEDRADARRLQREIETFIAKKLKSPTTAKFDLTSEVKRFGDVTLCVVDGNVTSQNGFGALITNRLQAMFVKQGDQYKFTSYIFEDTNLIVNQALLDIAIAAMQNAKAN
jgi:hypothetical protein